MRGVCVLGFRGLAIGLVAIMALAVLLFSIMTGTVQAEASPKSPLQPLLQIDSGGHKAVIKDIVFTPDGKYLVSASNDKTVRVWEWCPQEARKAGGLTGNITCKPKTVRIIRGQSGKGAEGKIYAMALSPDGGLLAVGGFMASFNGSNHIDVGTSLV